MLDFCKIMRISTRLPCVDCACGSYAYYSRHTNSSIDYILVKEIDRTIIDYLQVDQFRMFMFTNRNQSIPIYLKGV